MKSHFFAMAIPVLLIQGCATSDVQLTQGLDGRKVLESTIERDTPIGDLYVATQHYQTEKVALFAEGKKDIEVTYSLMLSDDECYYEKTYAYRVIKLETYCERTYPEAGRVKIYAKTDITL